MRTAFRVIAASIIVTAVIVALRGTSVSASRCFIDEVGYYEDSTCVNMVGAKARGCQGTTLWQWGDVTAYWDQMIDGGEGYCGCGGDEYHSYNRGTCDPL